MKYLKNLSGIFYAGLITMVFALSFASCDKDDDSNNNISGIFKFSPNPASAEVGKTANITISGGTAPYAITIGDSLIAKATVTNNIITVTGIKEGSTMITVSDKNKNMGKLNVNISKATSALSFDKNSLSIANGKEDVVTVNGGTAPYTATVKDATIATATVKDNKITVKGIKAGNTTINIADKDAKNSGSITVTIK
jgi:hypothetical protein